ncbi:hypothetical protein N2152v2_009106 [Parachlorella kessleri]
MDESKRLVARLTDLLAHAGIDIVCPLALSWYNNALPPALAGARIKPAGNAGSAALVVLVGNSKLVWEPFLEACSRVDSLLDCEHPFNQFVEGALEASLQEAGASRLTRRVYWSHKRVELEGSSAQFVAMQRMAHSASLAYLDHDAHLCLHPKYGPWFSLRAAVVFDDLVWDAVPPAPLKDPMCPTTRHYVRLAMETAIHCAERRVHRVEQHGKSGDQSGRRASDDASALARARAAAASLGRASCPASPLSSKNGQRRLTAAARLVQAEQGCGGSSSSSDSPHAVLDNISSSLTSSTDLGECRAEAAVVPADFGFEVHDTEVAPAPSRPSMDAVRSTWKRWVAVRDAPSPGHPWRYSEEQIQYHYTAERSVLLHALARRHMLAAAVAEASMRPAISVKPVGKLVVTATH